MSTTGQQEVRVSRFERVRGRLRRGYESARDTVRASRERQRAHAALPAGADGPEQGVASPADPGPVAPPSAAVVGAETPVAPHPSTVSQDDADVPHALRIAAAWSWRLLVVGLVGWALMKIVGEIRIVIIPLAV